MDAPIIRSLTSGNVQLQILPMKDGITCASFLVPMPIIPSFLSWATEHWGQDSMRICSPAILVSGRKLAFCHWEGLIQKKEDGEQSWGNDRNTSMGWGSSFLSTCDMVSRSPGWPRTLGAPGSTSQMLIFKYVLLYPVLNDKVSSD